MEWGSHWGSGPVFLEKLQDGGGISLDVYISQTLERHSWLINLTKVLFSFKKDNTSKRQRKFLSLQDF